MKESFNFLKEFLSSGGKVSSKRIVTFALLIVIAVCSLTELFTDLKVSDGTFSSLMYAFEVAIGTVVLEKFSKKNDKEKELNNEDS